MPFFSEQRVMPYSAEQLFALVSAVDRYPEFLPWCLAARITKREHQSIPPGQDTPQGQGTREILSADLVIGFKMVRERFTSRVVLDRPYEISVNHVSGPFEHLSNHWYFEPHPDGCLIDFEVDFKFKSRLLDSIMGSLFSEATRRMVKAFETRAHVLYGDGRQPSAVESGFSG